MWGWINKRYWLNFSSPKETGSRRSKFLNFSKIPIINLYNKHVQINSRYIGVFGSETNCCDHRVLRVTFHYCNGEKLYFARIGPTWKSLYLRITLMLRCTFLYNFKIWGHLKCGLFVNLRAKKKRFHEICCLVFAKQFLWLTVEDKNVPHMMPFAKIWTLRFGHPFH